MQFLIIKTKNKTKSAKTKQNKFELVYSEFGNYEIKTKQNEKQNKTKLKNKA